MCMCVHVNACTYTCARACPTQRTSLVTPSASWPGPYRGAPPDLCCPHSGLGQPWILSLLGKLWPLPTRRRLHRQPTHPAGRPYLPRCTGPHPPTSQQSDRMQAAVPADEPGYQGVQAAPSQRVGAAADSWASVPHLCGGHRVLVLPVAWVTDGACVPRAAAGPWPRSRPSGPGSL